MWIRLHRNSLADFLRLQGKVLDLDGCPVRLGKATVTPVSFRSDLKSDCVVMDGVDEPDSFLEKLQGQARSLGVRARPVIDGDMRLVQASGGELKGFPVRFTGLSPDESLRLLKRGIGLNCKLGCGVFRGS